MFVAVFGGMRYSRLNFCFGLAMGLSNGSKVPAVTITIFKYRNKIGKIVVKEVPYSVT
jgi:hypothetical protein